MKSFLQYILPFNPVNRFKDKATLRQFAQWDQPARYIQITIISFLTAMLYVVFNLLDKPWIGENLKSTIAQLHCFINVPILLLTSFLGHKKVSFKILMLYLWVATTVAMVIHIIISSQLEDNSYFIAEGYYVVL